MVIDVSSGFKSFLGERDVIILTSFSSQSGQLSKAVKFKGIAILYFVFKTP
jgi:hypothetical protein